MKYSMVFIILFAFSCKFDKQAQKEIETKKVGVRIDKSSEVKNVFVPDTTINKKLALANEGSLQNFYSGDITTVDKLRESPVVLFLNKSKDIYLLGYHYEGSVKNSFDCFEIGYLKDDINLNTVNGNYSSDGNFTTESGISLGFTIDDVVSIKGSNFKKLASSENEILIYAENSSSFLSRYNMPSYFMEFTFKENVLVKMKFGFDYP